MAVPSFKILYKQDTIPKADVTVKAIGYQWYWGYEYPDENIIFDSYMIETKDLKENLKELWLAFSPIKSNYFNFMMQKATELGVTKFLPIIFDRTIVRKINKERLEKVIIEAAEQSNRINVPKIEEPQKLKNFLSNDMDLIFTDLNTSNTKIDLKKLTTKPTCVIIGPEGDFSEEEREKILKFKWVQPIKINENILRSETAVISALSIINYAIN